MMSPTLEERAPAQIGSREPLTGTEMFWTGVAFVLPVLFVNAFDLPAWAPRYLTMPVLAGVGVTCLVALVRRPDRSRRVSASLALAFGSWAGLATLSAPNSAVAVWGRYSLGTGLIFIVALVGAWAGGASVRSRARLGIERALLLACTANALVGIAQKLVDLSPLGLATYGGRASGLYGNPVYLAAVLSGGLWLALCRLELGHPTVWATVVLLAAAVDVSGSRFGLILAVVAVVAIGRRLGWRRAAAGAGLVLVGLAVGTLIAAADSGTATTSAQRAGEAPASGFRPRVDTWYSAIGAIGDRPVLGWGPNGFLAATSPRRTLATARAEGPDRLFGDAHNIVVEYAVTTGLPGIALLAAWFLACLIDARRTARRAAGPRGRLHPLAGFGLFLLAMSLVEPLHVGVTPLAFLALGAAGVPSDIPPDRAGHLGSTVQTASGPDARRRPGERISGLRSVLTIGAAMAVSAVLASGLMTLRRADIAGDPALAISAESRLPAWAEPPSVVANLYGFRALTGHDPAAAAGWRRFLAEAARRDPEDPRPWINLGQALGSAGDLTGAHAAFTHALDRDPWSAKALLGLAKVEHAQGLDDTAEIHRRRLAQVLAR